MKVEHYPVKVLQPNTSKQPYLIYLIPAHPTYREGGGRAGGNLFQKYLVCVCVWRGGGGGCIYHFSIFDGVILVQFPQKQ